MDLRMHILCKNRAEAVRRYPQAVAFIEVEGGCLVFESLDEYLVWNAPTWQRHSQEFTGAPPG